MEIQALSRSDLTDGDLKYRARASDPGTSLAAAESSALFAGAHKDRILVALNRFGYCTAHEIAQVTGLTVVQVDRRLPELKRDCLIKVATLAGEDVVRDGFRVWVSEKFLAVRQQTVAMPTSA